MHTNQLFVECSPNGFALGLQIAAPAFKKEGAETFTGNL